MKQSAARAPKSTKWFYNSKKKMLVSYADKKSNVKKKTNMVLLLLTIQYEMRVSKDLQAKPQPVVSYDHMKGWVDVADLISAMASTPVKNKCWTMNECSLLHV